MPSCGYLVGNPSGDLRESVMAETKNQDVERKVKLFTTCGYNSLYRYGMVTIDRTEADEFMIFKKG